MVQHLAGAVMSGSEGRMHLRIWTERYYICAEDLGSVLFLNEAVPLFRLDTASMETKKSAGVARLNRSGRSILFELGNRCYRVPRDRFMDITLGEEISWPVDEIISDRAGALAEVGHAP
jgi:hypothetical protein